MPVIKLSLLIFALALQADPFVQGLAHFRDGDYAAAESSLTQALKQHDDPRARAFLALARAARGDCAAAKPELASQFAKSGGTEIRRLTGLALAQCEITAEHFEAALAVLNQLETRYPSDADVLYEVARLHMKAWDRAVYRMFQRAPASFRVNQLSGEVLEIQGKYAEAATEYRKAIAKNPNAVGLHFRLGRALLMSSHTPEAVAEARQQFEAELSLNRSDAVAEYELAQVLVAQRKPSEAGTHLERAVQIDPNFPEALIALAKSRLESKANNEAIELLERAVKLVPSSENAHYNLMIAYRNAGRMDDAIRQKAELDNLQSPPEGEFADFLRKLGEKAPRQ
jgi:tetratricopeptide (TPR) repeat protein